MLKYLWFSITGDSIFVPEERKNYLCEKMNFTEDSEVSSFNNSLNQSFESPDLVCGGATDEQFEWFEKFSYWSEVFQLGLGEISFISL